MDFDPRFIDYDFRQIPLGQAAGDLPVRPDIFGDLPVYEDSQILIPESDWKGLIGELDAEPRKGLDFLVVDIENQGQEGSCTSNATTKAAEIVAAVQFGKDQVVQLSPMSLYRRCGGGPNTGSSVDENIRELSTRGILPRDNAENKARFQHTHPPRGYYTQLPSGWEETAKQFAAYEWFDIRSVEGFISCLLEGFPVVYGRDGHAICAVRPVWLNGGVAVKYANSWGEWGGPGGEFNKGFGIDTRSKLERGARYYCFGLRAVKYPELVIVG